jgi:hypothetical protein
MESERRVAVTYRPILARTEDSLRDSLEQKVLQLLVPRGYLFTPPQELYGTSSPSSPYFSRMRSRNLRKF